MTAHLIPYAGQTAQPHLTPEAKAVRGGWTEERIEKLKELWKEGLSARQIADALGGGTNRNSVIGKIHRLGLSERHVATKIQRQRRTHSTMRLVKIERVPGVTPTKRVEVDVAEPVSKRLSLLERPDNGCRYIADALPPFTYCSHDRIPGSSYCEFHDQLCVQRVSVTEANRRVARAANWR